MFYVFKALPPALSVSSELAFSTVSRRLKINVLMWQHFHVDYVACSLTGHKIYSEMHKAIIGTLATF